MTIPIYDFEFADHVALIARFVCEYEKWKQREKYPN